MEENIDIPTVKEQMFERGFFEVNGYTFEVSPIRLNEENQYNREVPVFLYPRDENGNRVEDLEDKDLALHLRQIYANGENKTEGLFAKIKLWLVKHTTKRYRYYSDNLYVCGIAKWAEKKIKYNGKHISFSDLERKYKLTKSEIVKLLGYLEDLSFFQ